jgi:hypothetical protein
VNHLLALVGALMFAAAAWFGYVLSELLIARRSDTFANEVNPGALVAIAFVVGGLIGLHGARPLHLLGLSLIAISLATLVRCDLRLHTTPPWVSLIPLAGVCSFALVEHAYWIPLSALVVSLPFASVAIVTKGAGMSWSDVRIAALGTSLVGLFPAVVAFALVAVVAAFVQWGLRRKNGIQMAPYLIGATAAAALAFGG